MKCSYEFFVRILNSDMIFFAFLYIDGTRFLSEFNIFQMVQLEKKNQIIVINFVYKF